MQVEGMFDIPVSSKSVEKWSVDLELPNEWNIGLIVGPSGSGKTTIAKELWPSSFASSWNWDNAKSILDGFPSQMSIKEIVQLLSSVGFSSPPSWLRPFSVLSNGEQFRVNMARTLAELSELAVVDEFTSVVDRNVAKIGSSAIAKTVRRRNQKFIAVSCHFDIIDWLEPDWIYQPHTNNLKVTRGLLQRPKINLEIKRVHHTAWQIFRKHHYLNTSINRAAVCFVAFEHDIPVAFSSVLHFPHSTSKIIKREHRTVCLPDYQGIGIGNVMSDYVASICRGLGFRFQSQTSHPAMIQSRNKSSDWAMIAKPNRKTKKMSSDMRNGTTGGPTKRYRATFEYVGNALSKEIAQSLWNS